MKLLFGILAALLVMSGVHSLPARTPQDDAEVIDVPRRGHTSGLNRDDDDDTTGFRGVITTGVGYPFFEPSPGPFSFNLGFFDSIDDIFRRLRTRWFALPDSTADDSSDEDGFPFNLDPKKVNSTSTVKVVDGHKILVNDTTYGNDNHVFKVRIVNIFPVDGDDSIDEDDVAHAAQPAVQTPVRKADDTDDSDERREPLEHNKSTENEIQGNIDDPEVKQ